MTAREKEVILGLAYRYDKAAGLDHDDPRYRTIDHFDAMLTLMDLLDLKDEYWDYEPKADGRWQT